jgi:mono/diheme cytochrome c family protein
MKLSFTLSALLFTAAAPAVATHQADIRHGRYLIATSGCNDCHTAGFMQNDGHIAEADWLTGNNMGWQGPWGTTYPANLRLLVQQMDETAWVAHARMPFRPPMPAPSMRAMSDTDLIAMYRYIKHLGAKGLPAPAYVMPGGTVATPYFELTPKNLPMQAAK